MTRNQPQEFSCRQFGARRDDDSSAPRPRRRAEGVGVPAGAGRQRRLAAGRRAPAGKSAGHHADRARPASRAATGTMRWSAAARCRCSCATRATSRWSASRRTGRASTPNVAESYEVNRRGDRIYLPSAQGPQVVGRPAVHHRGRAVLVRGLLHRQGDQPRRQLWWHAGGEPAKLEVIDEQTFKVIFASPNGFFLQQPRLGAAGPDRRARPKHYLEQFHIHYNPDADKLAKEQGLESWIALFQREVGFVDDNAFFQNPKRPTLNAWMFTRSRPGRTPSRRSRCATPTTSRSIPKARSSPISTASSTRWSPIPRSCC